MKYDRTKGMVYENKLGITWKMFAMLVVFIICALLIVWFFQIQMLNNFYQNAKFYELDQSAEQLLSALDDPYSAMNVAERYADDYYIDIWVLEIIGDQAELKIKASGTDINAFPFLAEKLEILYSKTVQNGGKYIATVPSEQFIDGVSIEVLEDNEGNKDSYPKVTKYGEALGTLYSRLESVNERTFFVVQYATLSPLQTTVSTLNYQFFCIGVAMIFMAVILAVFMSKFITRPFIKMNEAAKKLAKGNYDADFSGEGYREINELAMTLNYASAELAKTNDLQKELISNISHDLRTPLTMIKGYSEVMRDIPGENTPENVQVIIDETTRLSELVNDMLDLSKIQAGTRKPDYEEFCITDVVRDTLKRYKKLIMQDGYKIEFFADRDATVTADSGMILQVIYNLINNAINYTGEDKSVCVRQIATDASVRITVTDTGSGIAPEDIAQIWDRYYRVDKAHKRATIGTGLGLSIVKEILEVHEASFGVDSTIGKGSTFWFELELAHIPEIINAEYDSMDTETYEDIK